jgi:hypothetical protein
LLESSEERVDETQVFSSTDDLLVPSVSNLLSLHKKRVEPAAATTTAAPPISSGGSPGPAVAYSRRRRRRRLVRWMRRAPTSYDHPSRCAMRRRVRRRATLLLLLISVTHRPRAYPRPWPRPRPRPRRWPIHTTTPVAAAQPHRSRGLKAQTLVVLMVLLMVGLVGLVRSCGWMTKEEVM